MKNNTQTTKTQLLQIEIERPHLVKNAAMAKAYMREIKEFSHYFKGLCKDFTNVFLNIYDDHITFRYLKGMGKKMITGSGKIIIDEVRYAFLVPVLAEIASATGKTVNYKTNNIASPQAA